MIATKTKSISVVAVVSIVITLIVSMSVFAYAIIPVFSQQKIVKIDSKKANQISNKEPIIGSWSLSTNEKGNIDGERIKDKAFPDVQNHQYAGAPEGPLSNGGSNIPCLTFAPLANASIEEISRFFAGAQYECYYHAWTFESEYSPIIFSAENVQFIAEEIQNTLSAHPEQRESIYGLVNFLHIAYYLQFQQRNQPINLNFLFENEDTLLAVKNAMRGIAATPEFFDEETDLNAKILYGWIAVNDLVEIDSEFLDPYRTILETFLNSETRKSSFYYNNLTNALLISHTRNRLSLDADTLVILRRIGTLREQEVSGEGIAFRASLVYQSLSILIKIYHDSNQFDEQIRNHMQKAYDDISQNDISYLALLRVLEKTNNIDACALVGLRRQCFTQFIPGVKRRLFPLSYEYDNGSIVVHTSMAQAEVDPLYFASHEVQAGFHRITQTIYPVEGDNAGILNIYIYPSRKDYVDYQYFLFAVNSVANGGIYLEENAQFFTYERTPQESIYSLEELFRHEYSHYLIGRYLIPGLWGQTPFYQNNRLVWFDEGMAEFLAGSRPENIFPRRVLVEQIARHERFMNISELVSASYSSNFTFYAYSGLFFLYLSENRFDLLQELIQTIRSGNIGAYDAFRSRLGNDENLNTDYHQFLQNLVNQLDEVGERRMNNPSTSVPPITLLNTDINAIQMELNQRTRKNFSCFISGEKTFARFSCRTDYSSMVGATVEQAWRQVQSQIVQIIRNAHTSQMTNMHHVVCRMGPFQSIPINGNSYLLNTVFCDGPLGGSPPTDGTFLQKITSSVRQVSAGANAACRSENQSVRCDLQISTFPIENREQINTTLQDKKRLFIAQVYASHPSLHQNISCTYTGAPQYIAMPAQPRMEYGVQNLICRWR